MLESVIKTHDLTCRFGDFIAVNKVNLDIPQGSICGFLGPNGSGKSTTMRMLCGILAPTSGSATILGYDVATEKNKLKINIGYMSQKFSLYNDLTVEENLNFYAGLYNLHGKEKNNRIKEMLLMADLEQKTDVLAFYLSGGVKQRLALGCAILHKPKVLFLDEPTSGVDPRSRRLFWDIIYDLAKAGTTVLVTTHFMDEADHCDLVGFIYKGELIAFDKVAQLKTSLRGHLFTIKTSDSIKTLNELKLREKNLLDIYIHGQSVRLLLEDNYQPNCSSEYEYESLEPSMEDVFAYYVKQQKGKCHE